MSGPLRLERDDGLAIITFDSPPLNLFDAELGRELERTVSELEQSPARAVLFRAEGRVVSGGVDVSVFAAQDSAQTAEAMFQPLIDIARRVDHLPCPTVFAAHALCLTWAFRARAGLRSDRGRAVGEVRPGREGGRAHPRHGRDAAAGGARRQRACQGAGDDRATVRCRDPRALERRQPRPARRGLRRRCTELAADLASGPTLAHAATKQVIRHYLEGGIELANDRVATVAAALFDTEDLRGAVASFLEEGPGKATFTGR